MGDWQETLEDRDPTPPDWEDTMPDPNDTQPAPLPSAGPAVWPLVLADMYERDRIGRHRYGTPLQAHNGRDALTDAYQECLDMAVYLRQAIEERRSDRSLGSALGLGTGCEASLGIRFPAQAAPTPSSIRATFAVGAHGAALPTRSGLQQLINFTASSQAHKGSELDKESHDILDPGILPGPACLASIAAVPFVGVARANDDGNSPDHVLVSHAAQDADEWSGRTILILSLGEVKAPFALQQSSEPGEVSRFNGFHMAIVDGCVTGGKPSSGLPEALDLAVYLRQAIEERPVAAPLTTDSRCQACGASIIVVDHALAAELARCREERDKLAAFKRWCHDYLDAHGVPHHPLGTHGAEGCRIGDRLDWLLAQLPPPALS